MKPIRVMVTGAGSMVGQGILKSLHISPYKITTIAADNSPYYAGLYRADEAVIIPFVEREEAYNEIINIINRNKIDIVMIGSEFDLEFFSANKNKIEAATQAIIIVSNIETVRLSNDKWLTIEFLKSKRLPHPTTYIANTLEEAVSYTEQLSFPFILKGRHGTSARNVHVISNLDDLKLHFNKVSSPILQEMIALPNNRLDSEYTCSIFKTRDNEIIGPFNSRRVLKNGSSWVTEVKSFDFLNSLLLQIGMSLDIMGTINVQLMNTPLGPVPFEFNARSSGTTAVRSYFGFNEPHMSIQNFYFKEKIQQPTVKYGYCLRYVEELFLNDDILAEKIILNKKAEKMDWF